MDKKAEKLIHEGKYKEAEAIADIYLDNYDIDEAEEIYNELYDRIADENGRDHEDAIYYLRRLAIAEFQKGKYDAALSMNNSVLEWCGSNELLNSEFAVQTMISVANIYEIYNRFDDEYEISQKALAIALDSFEDDDSYLCGVLKVVADSCISLGKYDEGIAYYKQLLQIYEEAEEPYVDEAAMVYDGLGNAYRYKGMPQKAKACFETGIELLKNSSDKDSENLLLMLNDLCNLYDILLMLDEALELRKSILKRAEELYGFEHPNVMVSKSNLADAYSDIGDYNTSLRLYEECYQWTCENLGPQHCETVRNMSCLSRIYRRLERYEEALHLVEKAYSSKCETLGENHIDSIIALEDVAFCYIDMKNYRIAKEIFAKTKKYFRDNFGEGTDYYYSAENYLYACALLGEYSDILEETDKLLELSKTFPEPADTDNIMIIKAITCRGLKKFDEAEDYQKKHIDYDLKKYGAEHPETLTAEYELAYIIFDKGDMKKVCEICSKTLEMQKVKSAYGAETIKSEILLSRIYSSMGELEKAAEILKAVLDKPNICDRNAEYSDACFAMAENLRNMKQYEKAKAYAEKALMIRCKIYEENHSDVRAAQILCDELKTEQEEK